MSSALCSAAQCNETDFCLCMFGLETIHITMKFNIAMEHCCWSTTGSIGMGIIFLGNMPNAIFRQGIGEHGLIKVVNVSTYKSFA